MSTMTDHEIDELLARLATIADQIIAGQYVKNAAALIRELRKDAERYRWLRGRYSGADMEYKDFGAGQRGRPVAIFSVVNPWPFSFDYERAADMLDAAIDAARKERK